MASGWGHALAGIVGGYMTGQNILKGQDAEKLAKEDRAYIAAQRERETKQQGEADKLQSNLRAAAQPVAMTEGAGGMVRPESMDNRDVGLPENAAQPDNGLMPMAYRVGGQGFEDRSAAQAAADQQNTPEAVNSRVVAAYQGAGQMDKAMQLQAAQRQAEAGDLQLRQAKEADGRDKAIREVITAVHKGGWQAVPEIYKGYNDGNSAKVEEDGKGGATIISIGPDGKELGRNSFAKPMDFITGQVARMDPKLWIGLEDKRADREAQAATAQRSQSNSDRDYQLRVATQGAVADRAAEANRLKAEENSIKRGEKIPENSTALRKEFEALPEVKNYKQALPSYKGIEDAVKRNTPMSDINIVYGIAKLYDPTSVVREGEYATVANAPAIPERVKGWVQYVAGGGKLTEQVKQQILTEAKSRMGTFETEFGKARTTYQDIAKRSNADPSLVISSDYKPAVPSSGTAAAPSRAKAPAAAAPQLRGKAEFDALPSGALFTAPDGTTRRKP